MCSQSFEYKEPARFLNQLGISMEIDFLKEKAPLVADGLRLSQVFTNFSRKYVDWAFEDDAALLACTDCAAYWNHLQNGRLNGEFDGKLRSDYGDTYKYGLGNLTKVTVQNEILYNAHTHTRCSAAHA